jgi:hypothetical protein
MHVHMTLAWTIILGLVSSALGAILVHSFCHELQIHLPALPKH